MGKVRRQEAIKAMKLLGLNDENLVFLGYPDWGTLAIFSQYWKTDKPYRSFLTRISSVPYKDDLPFGAPYVGESILFDLKRVIFEYFPTKIFISHPADTNRDHKALYLFLQIALRDLKGKIPIPEVHPYLVHSLRWPLPRNYHPELSLKPPQPLSDSQISWLKLELTPEEIEKKHQAILCYKSQTQYAGFYLLSFCRQDELFGDYPEIKLEKQTSLKGETLKFLGFSNMYTDAENSQAFDGPEDFVQDKGQVSYAVADGFLLIHIEKKELKDRWNFMLYLFGYSSKTPFASMPKMRIVAGPSSLKIFDGGLAIEPAGVSVKSEPDGLIVKIPLNILGDPDFILASIKAYTSSLPADTVAFRKIEIR
jgi:LmbE family N-acetylglucosaminyl deacetylase